MITFSAPQRPDPTISQRVQNIVIYSVFCSYLEHYIAICDVFSSSSPKIEPKHCFRNNQKSKCSQNTAICDTLATRHVRNAVFYSVFGTPSPKHWYLQCFAKTHAWNTVNTNEFKDYIFPWQQATRSKNTDIYSVSAQWFFQKNVLFGPFLASEASQNKEGGYTPPPPFHILNFKIFTKSKTWQFLELKTRPERHFLVVFTMFFARA